MCIIVYKPSTVENPSWKTLQRCFNNNPDGAGFMTIENGKVVGHKGFMNWADFKRAFKPYKNAKDLPIVMHFRITTNGGTKPSNCHPFPVLESENALKQIEWESEIGVAHNGIIGMTSYAKEISDTMEYIKEYMTVFVDKVDWYEDFRKVILLEETIDSRMAVLSSNGHCEIVGEGWVKENGVYFSNSSFRETSLYDLPYSSSFYLDNSSNYVDYEEIEYMAQYMNCAWWTKGSDEECFECPYHADCWGY